MSNVSEQMEEQLEKYEKDAVKHTAKVSAKVGAKLFAFAIARPTAKALAGLPKMLNNSNKDGKVTMEELTADGSTVKDLNITDENIKAFEPIARKYSIKYALKEITPKDGQSKTPPTTPTYMVFFKAKDESVLKMALSEFSEKELSKQKKKIKKPQSPKKDIKKEIAKNKKIIDSRPKNLINKNKNKER